MRPFQGWKLKFWPRDAILLDTPDLDISVFVFIIVNASKTAHFLLNFTLNKIKLAQIMNNRVYFVHNACYIDVQ